MAGWSDDGNAALAEADVHCVVEDRGEGVAGEGREKYQGHYCVGQGVVFLKLGWSDSFILGSEDVHVELKPASVSF